MYQDYQTDKEWKQFIWDFLVKKYGLGKMPDSKFDQLIAGVFVHRKSCARIRVFGLFVFKQWSYQNYLSMIDSLEKNIIGFNF